MIDTKNKTIKIGDDNYIILFSQEKIQDRIKKIAKYIVSDYRDKEKPPILLTVLTGGLFFGKDLSTELSARGFVHHNDTIGLKRYNGDSRGGLVEIISKHHADLKGRDVIVIEDIIDVGDTMNFLNHYLKTQKPSSINYSAICVRKEHGPLQFELKYPGFTIDSDGWVVGYGMDSEQAYRGLPDIYIKT